MKNLIIAFASLFMISVSAQYKQIEKVDSIVNTKIKGEDPALFVGVVQDGKIIYQKALGLSNLQHEVKANLKTSSNIASVAKQFTALMILQLSIDGKLSLEDDIRTYLPELYPKVEEKIKIRHLLNHTSGIRDVYDLMSIQQNPWWRRVGLDNDDVIAILEKQQDLAFSPGSRKMYSNSGYILLTKIIEVAAKEKFHDFSKRFFENIGVKNTQFQKGYMRVIPNQAQPYSDWGDGIWKQYPMLTNLYGDGFLYTTLEDQLQFEKAIQNANFNNDRLLIESQNPIPNSEIQTYGFGLELENRLNRKAVHHSGATGSYHAQTVRFPKEKISVFVMSSNSRIWSGFIADEVASVFLEPINPIEKYSDEFNGESMVSSEKGILGQYLSKGDYLIRVVKENNKILWRNANNRPIELSKGKDNYYFITKNPKVKIGFYEDKLIRFYPSGKTSIYTKINIEMPSILDVEGYVGQYRSEELDITFTISQNENKSLSISLPKRKNKYDLEILNQDELLVSDYILKVERDQFDRVIGFLLTTNRVLNSRFVKKTNLKFQDKIQVEGGTMSVTTIGSRYGKSSTILMTKNKPNGNEIWTKMFGGSSYDKASSIIPTQDGYLIVGSTSSFGKGNYDIFVIRTDEKGNKLWQNTYGTFYNDYGYSAELTSNGFLIKGTQQNCTSNSDVFNRTCTTKVWVISIDKNGKELSNILLETINQYG